MDNLVAFKQIDSMLKIFNRQLCLLNQIKKQGQAKQQLFRVFDAIITSRITSRMLLLEVDLQPLQNALQYKPLLIRSRDGVLFLMTEVLITFYMKLTMVCLRNAVSQPLFTSYFAK